VSQVLEQGNNLGKNFKKEISAFYSKLDAL
jgi:hypothetical protein